MTQKRTDEFGADAGQMSADRPSVEHHRRDLPGDHHKVAGGRGKAGWRRWWRALRSHLDAAGAARREWRRLHI